ncbi:MAG: VCBS repeat-containing protein [Planctomycetota bacterium]
MLRSTAVALTALCALSSSAPVMTQQRAFSPDGGRDAVSLFVPGGDRLAAVDLDADGRADAISGGRVLTAHLQLSVGGWIDRGIVGAEHYAIADMDGDGDPDLVTGSTSFSVAGPVAVYSNDGAGRFSLATSQVLWTGEQLLGIVAGDLDGDGDQDVVVGATCTVPSGCTPVGSRLYLLTNDGAGALTVGATIATGVGPRPALADLDADGDLDVLVAQPPGPAEFFENDGGGTLTPRAGVLPGGASDLAFHVLDADGDGDEDVLARGTTGAVRLLRNVGGALLAEPGLTGTWDEVAIGDFDANGTLDAATRAGRRVAVHRNGGAGAFAAPQSVFDRSYPCLGLAAGDFDGNGFDDLLASWDAASGDVVVAAFGGAAGLFFDPHVDHGLQLDAPPLFPVAVGDLDRDGDRDVALIVNGNNLPRALSVQFNLGQQRFRGVRLDLPPAETTLSLALVDVDGDGDQDVVEAGTSRGPGFVRVYANDGAGGLAALGTTSTGAAAALGDVDGDGDPDLVTACSGSVHLNDGAGGFGSPRFLPASGPTSGPCALALGDLDGDGDLDVVAPTGTAGGRDVLLNDGTGAFSLAPAGALPWGEVPWGVELDDVDLDGDLDVLVFSVPDNRPRLFVNDGAARFLERTGSQLPAWPAGAAQVLDLLSFDSDEDGDCDLLVKQIGEQRLYVNDGNGNYVDATAAQWQQVPSFNGAAAATDLDADGDVDVVFDGSVQWNHRRQLRVTRAPRLGGVLQFEGVQHPGVAPVGSGFVGLLAARELAAPLAVPFFRGRLQVDPAGPLATALLIVTPGSGLAPWTLPVAASPALLGGELIAQGVAVSSTHGFGFTNALRVRVLP